MKLIKVVYFIFIFLLLIILSIIFSNIKFEIDNFEIDTASDKKIRFNIKISIYLFFIIKINLFLIKDNNLKKIKKNFKNPKINILKIIIKNLKRIKLEKINLISEIGFINPIFTANSIAISGAILSNMNFLLRNKKNRKKFYFKINSIYTNENIMKLKFKAILSIKNIHILYMILKQKFKEEKINGRTSNRRSYANCNE